MTTTTASATGMAGSLKPQASLPSFSANSHQSASFQPHPQHCRLRAFRVNAQGGRGGPGDTESKEVLEAFFLGKALAEAITERLGTAVGEFLSDVGRWQAEQQKQIRDFQEEVQERARREKLKALQEVSSGDVKGESRASSNGTVASSASADTVSTPRSDAFQDS